ncbi:MAG: hypothetical protein AAF432_06800 [Planctomycetota bacterium]
MQDIEDALARAVGHDVSALAQPAEALFAHLFTLMPRVDGDFVDGVLITQAEKSEHWLLANGVSILVSSQCVEPFQIGIGLDRAGQINRGFVNIGDSERDAAPYGSSKHLRLEGELAGDIRQTYSWWSQFVRRETWESIRTRLLVEVEHALEIKGRFTVVTPELGDEFAAMAEFDSPVDVPVIVQPPESAWFEATASLKWERCTPSGFYLRCCFRDLGKAELPVGTRVELIEAVEA